jgi:protein O-mannosyl-transferase
MNLPSHRKAIVLVLLAGVLAYANAVNKGFVLDDSFWITAHPNIGNPGDYIWRSSGRPLVSATIALNYQLGGLRPLGYHAFNVGLHLVSAFAILGILRRMFALPGVPERWRLRGDALALAVALLWVVHPLNTQAVTYVIQRAESMMGMFFLLAFYAWIRGSTGRPWLWLPLAVGCFFLSCQTKEVAIVWPILALVFDRVFLAGSWKELAKRRWWAYLGLGAVWLWLLVPTLASSKEGKDYGIGFGLAVTPVQYALTETEVVWLYMKMVVWPTNQVGDYASWPIATSVNQVLPAALATGALVLVMLAGLIFRPKLAFPLFWALLILAPTSTFMPINDVAFEHRMYLPLVGILVLIVIGTDSLLRRVRAPGWVAAVLLGLAVALLARQTIRRNEVYRSNTQFFEDALAKRPHNLRAIGAVAEIRTVEGKLDEAGRMLDSMRNEQYNSRAYNLNLARWYTEMGQPEKARAILAAMVNDPLKFGWRFWAQPYPRLLIGMNEHAEAAKICRRLIAESPKRAEAHALLAVAELAAGHRESAAEAWRDAVAIDPQIGATIHAEARRHYFNPGAPELPEESKAVKDARPLARKHRRELAYHLANAVVTLNEVPELPWIDTFAMCAWGVGRWRESMDACKIGWKRANGDVFWHSVFSARMGKIHVDPE